MSDFEDDKDDDEKEIEELDTDESEDEEVEEDQEEEPEESQEEPEEEEGDNKEEERHKRPKLSSKERRERRKAIIERKRREEEELKSTVASLKKENQVLQELVGTVVEKTTARDFSDIEGRLNESIKRFNDADQYIQQSQFIIQKALDEGDTATVGRVFAEVEKAREMKLQAHGEYNALKVAKERLENNQKKIKEEVEIQPRRDVDEARKSRLRKEWIEKHSWFDGNSRHPDSVAALLINEDLLNEGYKPDTDAFWGELTNRVRKNIPHRFKQQSVKPKQIVAGRESAVAKPGSGNEGELPPAFRKVLNERYGRDKNDPSRKKAVAEYFKGLKEYTR